MKVTVNSYFSGAGLMDIGLLNAGIEINQAFELDSDACKTYRHNIGDHIKECNLEEQLVFDQECSEIMAFTYPCARYSNMADISGTRTGDSLFLHALRHLALAQPEAFICENVPGLRAFPVVMESMQRLPHYSVKVFCPVKTEQWLPQRRDRLIILGTKRPFNIRPPQSGRRIKLSEIIETDPQVTIPVSVKTRLSGQYRDLPIISDPQDPAALAPTVLSHYSKDKSTRLLKDKMFPLGVRPYTVRECARLQGLPDSFEFPVSNTSAYKQIGNGVSVPVGEWIGHEMMRYMKQSTKSTAVSNHRCRTGDLFDSKPRGSL